MLMWLDGYYAEEDAPPIVDFDKMSENGKQARRILRARIPSHERDHRGRQGDGRRRQVGS